MAHSVDTNVLEYECCVCGACRFTGSVKLKGVIIIGGEEDTHPSVMKLYVAAHMFLDICKSGFFSLFV